MNGILINSFVMSLRVYEYNNFNYILVELLLGMNFKNIVIRVNN